MRHCNRPASFPQCMAFGLDGPRLEAPPPLRSNRHVCGLKPSRKSKGLAWEQQFGEDSGFDVGGITDDAWLTDASASS